MADGQGEVLDYGTPLDISFEKGLNTQTPKEHLVKGYSPYCRNVWYDEHRALSKMPGTQLLLAVANNAFSGGPCYNLYNFQTIEGEEILIYQGLNTDKDTMKLWSLGVQTSYPAAVDPTDITPSTGLSLHLRCYFSTYMGKLVLTNGSDNLKYWSGSGTDWEEYHDTEIEQFTYSCVFDDRLLLAKSRVNPHRVIYSRQTNETGPYHYLTFQDYYLDGYNWFDVPTGDGDPIIGIAKSGWGSLLIFCYKTIFELKGTFENKAYILYPFSVNKGTVEHESIRSLGNRMAFVGTDRVYGLGNVGVIASLEDQKLQTEQNLIPLTSEIDNMWREYIQIPDPSAMKQENWSGSQLAMGITFDSGGTYEILPGDSITDGTRTAVVTRVDVSSGTFAGGDAAGTIYIRDLTTTDGDDFADNGTLAVADHADVATVDGATSFRSQGDFWLENCDYRKDDVSTNPPVINFELSTLQPNDIVEYTTADSWVNMNDITVKAQWYAQSFVIPMVFPTTIYPTVADRVLMYVKETGTLTSDHSFDLYVCDKKTLNQRDTPDLDVVFSTGTLTGDYLHGIEAIYFTSGGIYEMGIGDTITGATSGTTAVIFDILLRDGAFADGDAEGWLWLKTVSAAFQAENLNVGANSNVATIAGDTSPISTGCWVKWDMTYHPLPIGLLAELPNIFSTSYPTKFITVKPQNVEAANYLSLGYDSGGSYTGGEMVNFSEYIGTASRVKDYAFKVVLGNFRNSGYVYTSGFYADSDLDKWDRVDYKLDETGLSGYDCTNSQGHKSTRYSELKTIEFDMGGDAATPSWDDSWTDCTNGIISKSTHDRWIRFRLYFERWTAGTATAIDSFTLKSIKITYWTQELKKRLISSAIFEDRYWCSGMFDDIGSSHGQKLYFNTSGAEDDSDYVEVADDATLNPGTSDFSIVVRINGDKSDQIDATPILLVKADGADKSWGLEVRWDAAVSGNNKIYAYLDNNQFTSDIAPTIDGTDTTLVASFDRDGNLVIYRNGVSVLSTSISAYSATDVTSTDNLFIGANWNSGATREEFVGYINNVQFYHRIIGSTEALYLHNNENEVYSTTGLKLHLKMNDGSGLTVEDDSGNDNTGYLGGTDKNRSYAPVWSLD